MYDRDRAPLRMRDRGSRSRPVIHIQLTVAGDVKCVTLVLVCTLVAIREPLGVRRAHPQYEVPSPWAYSRCEASQVPHTHHLLRKHTDDGAPVPRSCRPSGKAGVAEPRGRTAVYPINTKYYMDMTRRRAEWDAAPYHTLRPSGRCNGHWKTRNV